VFKGLITADKIFSIKVMGQSPKALQLCERAMILSPSSTLILGESFGAIQPTQSEQPNPQNLEETERTHILKRTIVRNLMPFK